MMGERKECQAALFYEFSLEDHIGKFKRTKTAVSAQDILDKSDAIGALESKLLGLRDHMLSQPPSGLRFISGTYSIYLCGLSQWFPNRRIKEHPPRLGFPKNTVKTTRTQLFRISHQQEQGYTRLGNSRNLINS